MNPNLEKFFIVDTKNNCTKFIGDKLEILIPKRYENYGLLEHTENLNVLGIFEMRVNGGQVSGGLFLPATIVSEPRETYNTTEEELQYLVAVYGKNDIFISNMDVVKNDKLGYVLWNEFIALGNLPKFIDYTNIATLFDLVAEVCGINFNVNHAVFEMIYAHLFRDPDDITKEYRHTTMNKPPLFVELRNVSYGPDSTSAKLLGSYWNDGLNSALVNSSDKVSELDNILFR